MEIKVQLTDHPKAKTPDSELGFGRVFTDHMFTMDWDKENGWHDAQIVPFGNISLSPACNVFHYSQETFHMAQFRQLCRDPGDLLLTEAPVFLCQ